MRLSGDVSVVGGGNTGFNISAPLDCHIYLIDGGNGELALVDAGIGGTYGETERIVENIRRDGYDPERITKLFLTHYHADHAGGAWDWVERLPSIEVVGSQLTADVLTAGDEAAIALPDARNAGMYPADYSLIPCTVRSGLTDGRSFRFGKLDITPFDTPGHCDGHSSMLIEGGEATYFVGGDLIFWGGTIINQNIHDCSIQNYRQSIVRMAETVRFDALLPGHLTISMRDGKRHLEQAVKVFKRLGVPRNAV